MKMIKLMGCFRVGMIILRNHLVFGSWKQGLSQTNIKREERHQQKTEYRFMDEMLIDYSEKIVAIAGHRMEFTKIEYQIIEFLSMHPGQVFDKERIYAQVCGYDAEGDSRTITELVRRIRKKIADYSEKEYIETVWGIGYRWKK